MRCAGNSVVTRHRALSCAISYGPLVDGGVEAIGKLGRARFVMLQLGYYTGGCLLQFFALTKRLAIIFDDKCRTDPEENDKQLTSEPADSRTPTLFLIRFGHAQ